METKSNAHILIKVLRYAKEQKGLTELTYKQIHNLAPEAQEYLNKRIPKEILKQKNKLIKDAGYTQKTWKQELQASLSFYYLPSPEAQALNTQLKKLMGPYVINRVPYLPNYTASLLKNLILLKKPQLTRQKNENNIWLYRLA